MKEYEVETLKKGLMLLNSLQQEGGQSLTELAKKNALNKTSAFRFLYTLEMMGFVKKEDARYMTTNKMRGNTAPFNPQLNWAFVPPLKKLSADIGETVYIGILHNTDVVTTQVVEGGSTSFPYSKIGEYSPAHLSAHGKILLAFLRKEEQIKVLQQLDLVQKTKKSFVDLHLLIEHLKVIESQGYAIDDEETQEGLRCVSVPILYKDEIIAALSVSGSSSYLTKKKDKALSKKLIECAKEISKLSGKKINEEGDP